MGKSSRRPATISNFDFLSNKSEPISLSAWGLNGEKVWGLYIFHLLNTSRDRNKVDGVKLIAFSELMVFTREHGDIVSSSCDYFKQKEPFALCVGLEWTKGLRAFNIPPAERTERPK